MIRKGGDRHLPAENPAAHFAAYLTLAVLMLVWVGTASAQSSYTGFFIPNRGQSAYPAQANVFSQDFQDITEALRGNGVLTGMQVVQHSPTGMQVDVGTGTFQWQAVTFAGCAVTLTLAQADTINPRFDIISVPSSTAACPISGTGSTPIVTTGTPAGTPVPPTIPQTGGFNNIVLAVVYIPARTTVVVQNQIIDKRAFVATIGGGGGGGGGGTPGPPNGAVQFNNAGIFGGSTAPLHVKAFGTSRAAIQAAIDAAPNGSIIQFDCVTYTLDGTTLTNVASGTQKDLIFQGCTSAPIGFTAPFSPGTSPGPNFGTVLQGLGAESVFTITFNSGAIQHGVLFRDLNMRLGTGGKGITLTTGATVGAGLTVERTAINGGASAIVGNTVRGVTLSGNAFTNQTGRAVSLVGFNCDDGGINILNNNFLGAPGLEAIYLEHIAASVITGNFTLYYVYGLHVNMDTCTAGPGPTQFTVFGNQLETLGGGSGNPIWFEAGSYSGGAIAIVGNQLGQLGNDGDIIKMSADDTQILFGVTITGNTMATVPAGGFGCVNLRNVLGATVANNTCDLGSHADAFIVKASGPAMYGVLVSENTAINPVAGVVGYQGSGYTLISHYNEGSATPTNFAALPAVRDGSEVWCADCKTTSPCTGSGSGALAQRRGSTWQCVAAGIGPGAIADKQIVVGTGTGITGFSDFTWDDVNSGLTGASALTIVGGATHSRAFTVLNSDGPVTLDGSGADVVFVTALNAGATSISNGSGHVLVAAGGGTINSASEVAWLANDAGSAIDSANVFAVGSFHPAIDDGSLRAGITACETCAIKNAVNTHVTGSSAVDIADSTGVFVGGSVSPVVHTSVAAAVIGGTSGSIIGATNAVSLNGGVVATNSTTAVGGTRFDVTYLGGAGVQCLQADNNGTIQASGAACGGGGLAIPATQIVVGTGPSVASFADFTWSEADQTLNAGANTIGAGTTNSTILGFSNVTQAAANQGFIFGRNNLGSAGGQDLIVGFFNDFSAAAGGDGGLIGDNNSATVNAAGTSYAFGSLNVLDCSTCDAFGQGNTVSGTGGAEAHGQNNNVTGGDSYAFGFFNAVTANDAVMVGQFGSITHDNSMLIGFNGNSVAVNSVSIGMSATPEITIRAGSTSVATTNFGASANIKVLEEELTILAAANTDTAFQFPAGSTSLGCTVRVTTVIPTAVTFDTGVAGATTRYATGASTAANTTGGAAVVAAYATATSVRITPNTPPAAATGTVRVTCPYIDVTPPAS